MCHRARQPTKMHVANLTTRRSEVGALNALAARGSADHASIGRSGVMIITAPRGDIQLAASASTATNASGVTQETDITTLGAVATILGATTTDLTGIAAHPAKTAMTDAAADTTTAAKSKCLDGKINNVYVVVTRVSHLKIAIAEIATDATPAERKRRSTHTSRRLKWLRLYPTWTSMATNSSGMASSGSVGLNANSPVYSSIRCNNSSKRRLRRYRARTNKKI